MLLPIVENNPLFFNSAFGGLVVTTAAERFVAEFAANNTAGPDGKNRIYLDEKNLLAFFSVTKRKDGSLKYTPGHEKLLPSWHRRPLGSTFGLDDSEFGFRKLLLGLNYILEPDCSDLSLHYHLLTCPQSF